MRGHYQLSETLRRLPCCTGNPINDGEGGFAIASLIVAADTRSFLLPPGTIWRDAEHRMRRSMEATAPLEPCRPDSRNQASTKSCSTGPLPAMFVDKNEARPDGVDLKRIEAAVREILVSVGEDPDRDGLLETPSRVARMYAEMFAGLRYDPGRHLAKVFAEQYDEIVLVRDISFCSMCEHHLLPFTGVAHIAYLPSGAVVGLSKLGRLVDEVARRPQVQERMTQTIADLMEERLQARGVAVVLEASHSCMTIRGIKKPGSMCLTSAMRGSFRDDEKSRAEVMHLITRSR